MTVFGGNGRKFKRGQRAYDTENELWGTVQDYADNVSVRFAPELDVADPYIVDEMALRTEKEMAMLSAKAHFSGATNKEDKPKKVKAKPDPEGVSPDDQELWQRNDRVTSPKGRAHSDFKLKGWVEGYTETGNVMFYAMRLNKVIIVDQNELIANEEGDEGDFPALADLPLPGGGYGGGAAW